MVKNFKKAVTFSYDDGVVFDRKLIKILRGSDDIFFGTNREVFELQKSLK